MPRIAVTRAWLETKISEMLRVSRKAMSAADMTTYWNRITATVATEAEPSQQMRDSVATLQGYLEDLEERLDAKS